jgi:pyridoxamine 5'-phosphate oxidase
MRAPLQTPLEIREQIWRELARASQDRHHAWRTPVLATVGSDGFANARVVVLREVDMAHQTLRVYTDSRSPKVRELLHEPHAIFVFWSSQLNWQLRARVAISVETAGPEVQARWERVRQSASAADYLGPVAPGSCLEAAQSRSTSADAVHHFALLSAEILEMDWLELSRNGHRRANLREGNWRWLAH